MQSGCGWPTRVPYWVVRSSEETSSNDACLPNPRSLRAAGGCISTQKTHYGKVETAWAGTAAALVSSADIVEKKAKVVKGRCIQSELVVI